MILGQDPRTGYWTRCGPDNDYRLKAHAPEACEGQALCDVHNRRPEREQGYRLNWRGDRGIMEFICEHGVGHPTSAQRAHWTRTLAAESAAAEAVHGCDGCCRGGE